MALSQPKTTPVVSDDDKTGDNALQSSEMCPRPSIPGTLRHSIDGPSESEVDAVHRNAEAALSDRCPGPKKTDFPQGSLSGDVTTRPALPVFPPFCAASAAASVDSDCQTEFLDLCVVIDTTESMRPHMKRARQLVTDLGPVINKQFEQLRLIGDGEAAECRVAVRHFHDVRQAMSGSLKTDRRCGLVRVLQLIAYRDFGDGMSQVRIYPPSPRFCSFVLLTPPLFSSCNIQNSAPNPTP